MGTGAAWHVTPMPHGETSTHEHISKLPDGTQLRLVLNARSADESETWDGVKNDATGLDLWPTSRHLADMVASSPRLVRRAELVVELGCGAALPGIMATMVRRLASPSAPPVHRAQHPVLLTDGEQGVL